MKSFLKELKTLTIVLNHKTLNISPIAIFLYNRPDKTQQCLNSISLNLGFDKSPLYIFVDGPKNKKDKLNIEEVKKIILQFEFKNLVEVKFKSTNIGLAKSIYSGVQYVLSKHDRVIVLEDDLSFNESFIYYMNTCLEKYRNKNIYQVSGHLWGDKLREFINSPYLIPNINSWGWATWKEKWNGFELGQIDMGELKKIDSNEIFKFNLDGSYDYFKILKKHIQGKVDSWAIQWYYYVFKNKGYTIYPPTSLVVNNGMDGSGTHTLSSNFNKRLVTNIKFNYPKKLIFERNFFELFCKDLKEANSESILKKIVIRVSHYLKK
tara:strand:+ start:30 stop:992 length:963 start_codon:yes stop_codon:yes gene_type:complete